MAKTPATKEEGKKVEVTMEYQQDSKRYHRYATPQVEGVRNPVVGSLYFAKDIEVPDVVIVRIKS